jgi:cobalt-zinc-cadmium efflux system membrane fusion protein
MNRCLSSLTPRLLLFAAVFAVTLAGCGERRAPAQPAAAPGDPDLVVVKPEMLARLKLVPAGAAEIRETLRVASQVKVDEEHVARIGAPVTGRITEVRAALGDRVQAGAMLATINSTDLGVAQLGYLKAASQMQLHSRSVERARALLNADVIGSAELQRRESELSSTEAEMRAAADQLRVLGMSLGAVDKLAATRAVSSLSPITATVSGTVIERKVTQGQVVQPADALFTVADLSRVWVVAEVPEQQAQLVRAGEDVQIEIPALLNRDIIGRLIYVSDIVSPETRTITVRTQVSNPGRVIKPAMLASMVIRTAPQQMLAVPADALVRDGNRDAVFVQIAPNRFRLRDVKLGVEYNGMRAVLGGLKAGDIIVAEGGFHLNNERRRKELE